MLAASIVQRPLNAEVERFVVIRDDGSADDVLAVTLQNSTDSDAPLAEDGVRFVFEYRDKSADFITARDWGGSIVVKDAEDALRTERCVRVPAEGVVPAHGTRTLAVYVRFRNFVRVSNAGELMLDDPLYALDLLALPVARIGYRATVVFPGDFFRRKLVADNAQITTSRTASWEWGAGAATDGYLQMRADQRRGVTGSVSRKLDDAIAEVYRNLVRSYIQYWPETDRLRKLLCDPYIAPRIASEGNLPDEEALLEMRHDVRAELYRALLTRLFEVRKAIFAEGEVGILTADGTVERAEEIFRHAEKLRDKDGVTAPWPQNADEVLLAILHYQEGLRKRPRRWPDKLDEGEFHQHFAEMLSARGMTLHSEVLLSAGRVDVLLGETPIELKIADLKGQSDETIRDHYAQAVEYAISSGKGLVILVVLDTHSYPELAPGPPGAPEQCQVETVPTLKGVSGAPTHVVVITVVVLARLPRPSKLRRSGKRKAQSVPAD